MDVLERSLTTKDGPDATLTTVVNHGGEHAAHDGEAGGRRLEHFSDEGNPGDLPPRRKVHQARGLVPQERLHGTTGRHGCGVQAEREAAERENRPVEELVAHEGRGDWSPDHPLSRRGLSVIFSFPLLNGGCDQASGRQLIDTTAAGGRRGIGSPFVATPAASDLPQTGNPLSPGRTLSRRRVMCGWDRRARPPVHAEPAAGCVIGASVAFVRPQGPSFHISTRR